MRKFVWGMVLVAVLLALTYTSVKAPEKEILPFPSPSQEPPLVWRLTKDRDSGQEVIALQADPAPVPNPTPPLPALSAEEMADGDVMLAIDKIGVEAELWLAQVEVGTTGPSFVIPLDNPSWIDGWSTEIGSSGMALIYGHRQWGPFGKVFSDLDKLESGDLIVVSGKEEIFEFSVFATFVVEPEDFWPTFFTLQDNAKKEGWSLLALLTCTPWGTANQRLIVLATLTQ